MLSTVKQSTVQYFLVLILTRKVSVAQVHESPYAPRLEIGPYHPWPWEGRIPTEKYQMQGRHPAQHPGYQTNIVIDPSGKVNNDRKNSTKDKAIHTIHEKKVKVTKIFLPYRKSNTICQQSRSLVNLVIVVQIK